MAYQIPKLTRAKPLITLDEEWGFNFGLVVSQHGFLLVFTDVPWQNLMINLRPFDLEDWHCDVHNIYAFELEGLDEDRMRDASILLQEVPKANQVYINPELLDLAQGNLNLYNRLHSTDPAKVTLRVQALRSIPFLRWFLAEMDDISHKLRTCIDTQGKLWDAIHAAFPGRKATLKRLAQDPYVLQYWKDGLPYLQSLLDELPLEKFPCTPADWQGFVRICSGLRIRDETSSLKVPLKKQWLKNIANIGWKKFHDKYADAPEQLGVLGDAFDFLDELALAGEWLVNHVRQCRRTDQLDPDQLYRLQWQSAPQAMGMAKIVQASIAWHRLLGPYNHSQLQKTISYTWPALLKEPVQLTDEIRAIVLNHSHALHQEGSNLGHCVAGYANRCYQGNAHIVSLRDKEGRSLSTLEIVQSGGTHWRIVQHRAYANSMPSPELLEIEPQLLKHIKEHADLAALEKWKQAVQHSRRMGSTSQTFDMNRLRLLSQALGKDRLLRLFIEPAVLQAAEQQYKQANV